MGSAVKSARNAGCGAAFLLPNMPEDAPANA